MKKLLLSVLACGMFVSAFSQIDLAKKITTEASDKWVLRANNLKATTGRLLLNNPPGSKWIIYVYKMADNKYITSANQSNNKGLIVLPPGEYKITINNAPVLNVPVKKGHDTKLETGLYNVTDNDVWYLYDETGKIYVTSGNKPKKLLMPVGNYVLDVGGTKQPVVVNETAVANEPGIEIKDEPPSQVNTEIIENEKWVITPLEAMTADMGKLSIIIPKDTTVYIIDKWITMPIFIRDTIRIVETGSSNYAIINLPKYLTPKTYNISLNRVRFTVPVRSGKETRVKAGFLIITKKEDPEGSGPLDDYFDTVFGENDGVNWEWKLTGGGITFTGKKRTIFALPPGEYSLTKFDPSDGGPGGDDIHYKVIIKDGEWVKNGVRQ